MLAAAEFSKGPGVNTALLPSILNSCFLNLIALVIN